MLRRRELRVKPNLPVLGPEARSRTAGRERVARRQVDFEELGDGRFRVNGLELEPGEVLVERVGLEGWAVAAEDGLTVALDTTLDDELRLEARLNDLIRDVQVLRKETGLEIVDRIRLWIPDAELLAFDGSHRRGDAGALGRAGPRAPARAGLTHVDSRGPLQRPLARARIAVVTAALVLLAAAPSALAGEPPNPHDPCSSAGRDSCGTTGVGFYDTYRYGLRWFGDYRGAVTGEKQTFCIDLQYWYPSPSYRYRALTGSTLVNRDGETVSLEHRRRMAYAMWTFGRTDNPNRQAAVMLYVHSLVGAARPGEVDPRAVNDAVAELYTQIAADSVKYHGPYRVTVDMPGRLRVGERGTATVRVLSASGAPVPDVELRLSGTGARVASSASTGADGVASVAFTPTTAASVTLDAQTEPVAATLPVVYAPTKPAPAANGQRLAAPSSQVVTGTGTTTAFKAHVGVASTAEPATLVVGATSRDKVTIADVDASYAVTVSARLYGPFRSTGAIACNGTPAWEGQWKAAGPGTYTTPAVKLTKPGWYVYRQVVPESAGYLGVTTNCTEPTERVKVDAQPAVHTTAKQQSGASGAQVTDTVVVTGLAGEDATVQAALYGPFPTGDAISCGGTPVWKGTVDAHGDGTYTTDAFALTEPGYYTYRESIVASEFVRGAETACADSAETTILPGTPQVKTQISKQQIRPGAALSDKVIVSGIGGLAVTVKVALYGPFQTHGGISCSGTPLWTGTLVAKGNGTYTTAATTIEKVGYYTYRESIAAAPQNAAFTGTCAAEAETTLATAAPTVGTLVSADVVVPGARISDAITVSGLGSSAAKIGVELFGPFATRAAIKCTGKPYATGEVVAHGDGTVHTQAVVLRTAGFYVYREKLAATDLIAAATTDCGLVGETSLARPLIITGRNDVTAGRRVASADPLTPTRVTFASLGIDAPVSPAGIDLKQGVLDVPPHITHLGWWLDGMTPGSTSGAVLIAGHVDSAAAGAGAFFRLKEAKKGDRIQVTTKNGRTFTYRVTSVQTMPKQNLPTGIFSRNGGPRLVLVTCGGPFDPSIRRYRDNVVVTAVPA